MESNEGGILAREQQIHAGTSWPPTARHDISCNKPGTNLSCGSSTPPVPSVGIIQQWHLQGLQGIPPVQVASEVADCSGVRVGGCSRGQHPWMTSNTYSVLH
eukprot:2390337-Amphidinium_carterae.1